ncbi:MAG: DNA cytosine methyltransferase [Opitutaceae bacterium]|nr:DNA cytosine methyltransferase [Cytophagales bacterium]
MVHNKSACQQFRKQNIDLLSGGPPCQSFSLAGRKVKDDYKNLLPLAFAKFEGLIQPKVILLENVKGIKKQLQAVKPKLVIVLGKETAKFLTKAFPNKFTKWENIQTLKQFYANKDAVFNHIEFEGEKIRFVFVLHPSMSNTNRTLIWGKGSKDEVRILNKALYK